MFGEKANANANAHDYYDLLIPSHCLLRLLLLFRPLNSSSYQCEVCLFMAVRWPARLEILKCLKLKSRHFKFDNQIKHLEVLRCEVTNSEKNNLPDVMYYLHFQGILW